MRKLEYINNCKKDNILFKPIYYCLKFRYKRKQLKLGFTIPINVFGEGLNIAHVGTIVVNPNCVVGKNCRIHVCVNIGGTDNNVPKIGDNVYIGPGAKIFGSIQIADGIAIGANAVVNKSFLERSTTIVGSPARVVSKRK
ncbi:serine acetyltransferase [Terribacillus sp. DMT04]|nr:serine acetyltransferase [Terribacillus sp. DMT04]